LSAFRWVESTHKGADAGKFVLTAGKFYGDAEKDKGIQTSQDAKFYALSAEFKPFSNRYNMHWKRKQLKHC
jgi:calreticulin